MTNGKLVYISYSKNDREWVDLLKKRLTLLNLNPWDDRNISAGSLWREEMQRAMDDAVVAVLLVSQDYLSDSVASQVEATHFLKRFGEGNLAICWVPVRPVIIKHTELEQFQPVWPKDSPLTSLKGADLEHALNEIAETIAEIAAKAPTEVKPSKPTQTSGDQPFLELTSLELEGVRCFDKLSMDFTNEGETVRRSVILGDNAVGKTTILRALALGLCDQGGATALINATPGYFISEGRSEARITVRLRDPLDGSEHKIDTLIRANPGGSEQAFQSTTADFPWARVFICGYGTERNRPADGTHEGYRRQDAVAGLFDYDVKLLNPELVLRRQSGAAREALERMLLAVLMLNGKISYGDQEFHIGGPWGRKAFAVLSDGYRGTSQWIMDMLGRQIGARGGFDGELSGIVLVDEIDQHLHPRWQRSFMGLLEQQFPKIQFITTTHSPVLAGRLGGLNHQEAVFHLQRREGSIEIHNTVLRGLSADQVLASEAFNYLLPTDPKVEQVLAEASRLAANKQRTKEEEQRYQQVLAVVNKVFHEEGDSLVEREARKRFYEGMQRRINELEEAVLGEGQ